MAKGKNRFASARQTRLSSATKRRDEKRKSLLEALEQRQLLAVGPQLIGVQPDGGDLLINEPVRDVAPRELVFRFDENQQIDPATLEAIRITGSGGDGSFGLLTASSDFGSVSRDDSTTPPTITGGAEILLTSLVPGRVVELTATRSTTAPSISFGLTNQADGSAVVSATLPAGTTAAEFVRAINDSAQLSQTLAARLQGGHGSATLLVPRSPSDTARSVSVTLDTTRDSVIDPAFLAVGDAPNRNEVVARFAQVLEDDVYQIDVFGFDDPDRGITGLRNLQGDLLEPRDGGRQETRQFRLDLGAQVATVVPQPVIRLTDGSLQQRRNEVVVHFNDDNLFVENDASGSPTDRSAENPRFYTLILTRDTVNNRDDLEVAPSEVIYNPSADTATLVFENYIDASGSTIPISDLADLFGGEGGTGTFRLRVGTAEAIPLAPQRVELGETVGATDLNNTENAVLRLQAQGTGPSFEGIRVEFINSGSGGTTVASVVNRQITVDLGGTTTLQAVADAINGNAAAAALVQASVTGPGGAVVGDVPTSYAAVHLVEPGDTFTAAANLGEFTLEEDAINFRGITLTGSIDPISYALELLGGNDDPGHRELPEEAGRSFEQHINDRFGADTTDGVTTIPYNFQQFFGVGAGSTQLQNSVTARQKERIREALDQWGRRLGVQFFETPDTGITFATGDLRVFNNLAISDPADTRVFNAQQFGVRVDPRVTDLGDGAEPGDIDALVVLDGQRDWGDRYGEDYYRTAAAAIGMVLGLEVAPELPTTTLMALSTAFLQDTVDGNQGFEPVFPGNYDILHGQYVFRPESGDIDLYRFEVKLDDPSKRGLLIAETFAERKSGSSTLDTNLRLFRQIQASVTTDFGLEGNFGVVLDAVPLGKLGNGIKVQLVSIPGTATGPQISVNANTVQIFITDPAGTTLQELVDSINAHPEASQLVNARADVSGETNAADITLAGLAEDTPPVALRGGGLEVLTQNDDYFSEDSLLRAELGDGVYYVGVSSTGNNEYDPTIPETGFGGTTEGDYELLLKFRPQVDERDVLRDIDGNEDADPAGLRLPGTRLDGDGDGVPGGVHNFWFQTRPLDRRLQFQASADASLEGKTISITDNKGLTRRFEFSQDSNKTLGNILVPYSIGDSPSQLASSFANVVTQLAATSQFDGTATADGPIVSLARDRTVDVGVETVETFGRTIFVDKTAGPQADGSQARPFNNVNNPNVPNAFGAAQPGDLVRIVGNGGADADITTVGDNFAYEFGFNTINGAPLEDGTSMELPRGITTMVDAGAVLKFRRSYVGVGTTSLLEDRSGSALQVLGTPHLVDPAGRTRETPSGLDAAGTVFFTSWLDESIGQDRFGPTTTPAPGNWGGIQIRRDLDQAEGRIDLENKGIFLNHIGGADIRYGGSKDVVINAIQQVVNAVHIIDARPTVTRNVISFSADAAVSATPDSFEETNFQDPRFQFGGAFTADYTRVGPDVHNNQLFDNSVNGMFVRSVTPAAGTLRELTVAGRFDDTDIVHYLAENVVINGTPGGSTVNRVRPPADATTAVERTNQGGTLAPGDYEYYLTFVDNFGNETLPNDPSAGRITATVTSLGSTVELSNLAAASSPFRSRRLYRVQRDSGGAVTQVDLIDSLNARDTTFVDRGQTLRFRAPLELRTGANLPFDTPLFSRLDASLVIDPGTVIKLEGSRIELQQGTQLLAEGFEGQEIVFTSKLDDRFGAGGEFDTDNDGGSSQPRDGNWGGIYAAPGANISLDHTIVAFGGGLTRIEGTFKSFNVIELQQADARITNSSFQDNANGQGGQGPVGRFGRLNNTPATIFSRGTEPIIVGNDFIRSRGSVIDIDANSIDGDRMRDVGRQTGPLSRFAEFDDNHSILVRLNRIQGPDIRDLNFDGDDTNDVGPLQDISGMEIRGDLLTTESIWDDTDIVHVLFDSIVVDNLHSNGGLRLQSSADESLVVKFLGLDQEFGNQRITGRGSDFDDDFGTGLRARGTETDITDRIGGTLHVVGRPGAPVVLTSLYDDSVGAGVQPDGTPQLDTNNDSIQTRAFADDWRGIVLDQYSNDRNVEILLEQERSTQSAPGPNGTVQTSQVLGDLAADEYSGDENLRMGFKLEGFLSAPEDIDVYSFTGVAGTQVWVDIDRTQSNLDTVLEILDANGNLLARSNSSTLEVEDESLLLTPGISADRVSPLAEGPDELIDRGAGGLYDDYGTSNVRDAGLRFVLPGVTGTRSVYHFRVRSEAVDPENIAGGLTSGGYEVQVRMREDQEFPGSTVRYADIRYAKHGVHMKGLPAHSPLLGEAQEDESASFIANNDSVFTGRTTPADRAQFLGNILASDRATISVGGSLSSAFDADFYQFDVNFGNNSTPTPSTLMFPATIDVDYADQFGRPDTTIVVFYDRDGELGPALPELVLMGGDSNIADDQAGPLTDELSEDFIRGSLGTGDGFIGPVELPEGTYYVGIVEQSQLPTQVANNPLTRREPNNAIVRIAEDHVDSQGGGTAAPPVLPELIPGSAAVGSGWSKTGARGGDVGHGPTVPFNAAGTTVLPVGISDENDNDPLNDLPFIGNAQNLDALPFTLSANPSIFDSTGTPHTTIRGTGDGTVDVFSFTYDGLSRLVIDIDDAFDPADPQALNSVDLRMLIIDGAENTVANIASSFSDSPFQDPYFDTDALTTPLAAGTYFIALGAGNFTYDDDANRFVNANPPATQPDDVDFDRALGVPAGGSYNLHVSLESQTPVPTTTSNQSWFFDSSSGGSGTLLSNDFDLSGYSAGDQPRLYVNYLLNPGADDNFTAFVEDSAGNQTTIGSIGTGDFVSGAGTVAVWRQAVLDLGAFAGEAGLQLGFRYEGQGTTGGEGMYLDDFIIGFAERGEIITGALPGDDNFVTAGAFGTVTSGEYQIEMRRGTEYGTTTPTGLTLDRSFDTNDRFVDQAVTMIAPAGDQLSDGDFFELADGANRVRFEFDSDVPENVTLGNIRVPFSSTDSPAVIAGRIIAAINSPQVQAILQIEAASSRGDDTAAGGTVDTGGDAAIHLFGDTVEGDFLQVADQPQTESVAASSDAAALAQLLVGPGVSVVSGTETLAAGTSGAGTFSGMGDLIRLEDGVVLSNGDVSTVLGQNTADATTGTASGMGDADVDASFGLTATPTVDSSSLQFDINLDDPGTLTLDLVFASEEYSEDATVDPRDIVAVYVDGNLVQVNGNTETSTDTYPTGHPAVTDNDPASGSRLLQRLALDGFTRVLRATTSNLTAGNHTVKVVVAEQSDSRDSVVFLGAGSLTTQPNPDANLIADSTGRVTMPARLRNLTGDENTFRDQGQVLIQNNTISDVDGYGVWSEAGEREVDPEDIRPTFRGFGFGFPFPGFPGFPGFTATPTEPHEFLMEPRLGKAHPGAVRNLRVLNDIVQGGMAPGVVIQNNIVDSAGLSGVTVAGETVPLMITPTRPGSTIESTTDNDEGIHFGDYIVDGATMIVDAGHVRVTFEFEDIGGGNAERNPVSGSTVLGGDGVAPGHVPIYFRHDGGGLYNPNGPNPIRNYGDTQLEVLHNIRDAIIGSILVTNGHIELVDVEVGPALTLDSFTENARFNGDLMNFVNPALYIYGASNIYFDDDFAKHRAGIPLDVEPAPIHEAPQPFARVINNTIYGQDGNLSNAAGTGADEPNDVLTQAVQTYQGRSHTPEQYTTTGFIGDSPSLAADRDVDFYQVNLDVGDRMLVNVDTAAGGLDTTMRLFNSLGQEVQLNTEAAAPGEQLGDDPFVDFTARQKDTYYIGISAAANEEYDALSLAGRRPGVGTGSYDLSIDVFAPRNFVIMAEDPSSYADGDTFTITQIPDLPGQSTNEVTFEFDFDGNVAAGNIRVPILASPAHRAWDVARAIAGAINGVRDVDTIRRTPAVLPNYEAGAGPDGLDGPITRVMARPLGGINGDEPGLVVYDDLVRQGRLRLSRFDHPYATGTPDSQRGFGHDRTGQVGSNAIAGTTTDGAGTSEQYVVVSMAARIDGDGAILLDPEPGQNSDQLIPEAGIMVMQGASPTLLNNVIVNTHTGVVDEVSRFAGFGDPTRKGGDFHTKPNEVIVGGSVFQGVAGNIPVFRRTFPDILTPTSTTDLELQPSNVGADNDDFNQIISTSDAVLVNPGGDNFLPRENSPIIDASIDSLLERDAFDSVKRGVGIAPSPVLAPRVDVFGQLRSDDPDVSTPSGLGGDVFKDRGAVDRADFIGPDARLTNPEDNDAEGLDTDPTLTVVELADGTVREFRIELNDAGELADPFVGIGVDDDTVVGPQLPGLRSPGAVVTLFENNTLLEEGVDYSFRYDRNTNEIILTPLAGVFRSDRFYRIEINNRDRYVVSAPAGPLAVDGDQVTITDSAGGTVVLEFETGFQLRLPSDLVLQVPAAGGGAGGVLDGDRITVRVPGQAAPVVFEFDRDGETLPNNTAIPFRAIDTDEEIAETIADVISSHPSLAAVITGTSVLPDGRVRLNAVSGVSVDTGPSAVTLPAGSLVVEVTSQASDGERFTLSDGTNTVTFELDSDGVFNSASTPVSIQGGAPPSVIAEAIQRAIVNSDIAASPQILAPGAEPTPEVSRFSVALNLPDGGAASAVGPGLAVAGLAQPVEDGDTITLAQGGSQVVLEFTTDGTLDNPSAIPVNFTPSDSADQLAIKIATALRNNGLDSQFSITPQTVAGGILSLGGTEALSVSVGSGTPVSVSGQPGVEDDLNVTINGPLILSVPPVGGVAIPDASQFAVTVGGVTTLFEFEIGDGLNDPSATPINFNSSDTADDIAAAIATALNAANLGVTAAARAGGRVDVSGLTVDQVETLGAPINARQGTVTDGERIVINDGTRSVTFEFEASVGGGGTAGLNTPVLFTSTDEPADVAARLANAINNSLLNITASVDTALLSVAGSGGAHSVADGSTVRVSNQGSSALFEINSDGILNNASAIEIVVDAADTPADIASALSAAINAAGLGATTTARGDQVAFDSLDASQVEVTGDGITRNIGDTVFLSSTRRTTVDIAAAPTLSLAGRPGGAVPVRVINAGSFTSEDVRRALISAINTAGGTTLVASTRGGNTLFVENAITISDDLPNFFLPAVADRLDNPLKANQADDTTRFTILLPGVAFDYGDAPDPVTNIPGRYPTLAAFDGARHLITPAGPGLGRTIIDGEPVSLIDADADGQPQIDALGDDQSLQVTIPAASAGVFSVSGNGLGPVLTVTDSTEGATLVLENNLARLTFELDRDGQFNEDFIRVPVRGDDTLEDVAESLATTIRESALRLAGAVADAADITLIADDEDGVRFGTVDLPTNVIVRDRDTRLQVDVTGRGFLDAWIDFNADGDWQDPGEQIADSLAFDEIVTPTLDLPIRLPATSPVPTGPNGTLTMARFRVSSTGNLETTGLALDGEVEDHAVRIVGRPIPTAGGPTAFTVVEDNTLQVSNPASGVLGGSSTLAIYAPDIAGTITTSGGGSVDMDPDGTFTYTPAPDFFSNGSAQFPHDTFVVRAIDESLRVNTAGQPGGEALLLSDPVTVTISVNPVNDTPFRSDDRASAGAGYTMRAPGGSRIDVAEDTPRTFSINDLVANLTTAAGQEGDDYVPGPANEIAEGQTVDVSPLDSVSVGGGTVVRVGNNIVYTPAQDFTGDDSFVLEFSDSNVPAGQTRRTTLVTVEVNVEDRNDAPIAVNQSYTVNESTTANPTVLNISAPGLLNGASDPEGEPVSVESIDKSRLPAGTDVTFNSNGSFTFTAPANFNGTVQFDFTVTDNDPSDPATTTRTATINVTPTQDPPVTNDPSVQNIDLVEDGGSAFIDLGTIFSDPDAETLNYTVLPPSDGGIIDPSLNGPLLEIAPVPNANTDALTDTDGRLTLQVRATDAAGASTLKTFSIRVAGRNDAPELIAPIDDIPNAVEDDRTNLLQPINLGNHFRDVDNQPLQYTVTSSNPSLLTATVQNNQLVFDLAPNASGTATLTVQASDGTASVSDQFVVMVAAENDDPVAADDPAAGTDYTLLRGGVLTISNPANGILANDSDPDGEPIQFVRITQQPQLQTTVNGQPAVVTGPEAGTLTLNQNDGTFSFEYASGDTGDTVTFRYEIRDPGGRTDEATVTITIGGASTDYQNPVQTGEEFDFFRNRPNDPARNFRRDTSGDGEISPIDALLVINLLNRSNTASIGIEELDGPPPPFYDVNGSADITPQDALIVINWLNSRSIGQLGGEGEAAPLPASSIPVSHTSVGRGVPADPQWLAADAPAVSPADPYAAIDSALADPVELEFEEIVDGESEDSMASDSIDAVWASLLGEDD